MLKKLLIVCVVLFVLWLGLVIFIRPSNERDWSTDQAVLPFGVMEENLIHLKNIRNFTYESSTKYEPGYYDKTFDLNSITNVYFIMEPLSSFEGIAHTMLSFEFEGGNFISISVEIRKEKGESFSPISGLFRQYEIMYVIADERDIVKLRSNYRKDPVYLYPGKPSSHENLKKLFLSMIERANELKDHPEFYNTLTNTCTTNIVSHINDITAGRVPFSYKVLLPGYSDELAYKLGLIDTNLPFKKIREYYKINDQALKYADSEDFSIKIRERPKAP
ncbi:MAG: DUF4105 domain-containing protein [Leptospirales bacterium]